MYSNLENKMKGSWDDKAKENAYHWVDSTKKVWDSKKEYYERGCSEVESKLLKPLIEWGFDVTDFAQCKALDIGCGTGRLTRALGERFESVDGIDISGEMLGRAREDNEHVKNIFFHQGNGVDLANFDNASFHFVFSFIVFQHIPSKKVVRNYFKEIYRTLKIDGMARFQVRGYPGMLRKGISPSLYKGFDSFYVALDFKRGLFPFPIIRKYTTVYGCFFNKTEIEKELDKIGFKNLEVKQDKQNERYLWVTAQK